MIDQQSKGYDEETAGRICGEIEKQTTKEVATVQLMMPEMEDVAEPADSFLIFPKGAMSTSKGVFVFDDVSAAMVMAAYERHGIKQLPIDYDHGMLGGQPSADSSSAAGWFVPAVTDDGLMATNVQWTPKAKKMLKDREFRHYSPAFDVDMGETVAVMAGDEMMQGHRITRLVNVALTNLPATHGQMPLVANAINCDTNSHKQAPSAQQKEPAKMELIKLFGLTSEAEVAQQATQLLSAVDGAKTLADVLACINDLKAGAAKSIELAQRVAALEAEKAETERDALIAKLSEDGKAPPSIHGFLRTLSIEQVKSFGECAPVAGGHVVNSDAVQQEIMLSEDDEHVLSLMPNVSREAFIAERKRETNNRNKKAG